MKDEMSDDGSTRVGEGTRLARSAALSGEALSAQHYPRWVGLQLQGSGGPSSLLCDVTGPPDSVCPAPNMAFFHTSPAVRRGQCLMTLHWPQCHLQNGCLLQYFVPPLALNSNGSME